MNVLVANISTIVTLFTRMQLVVKVESGIPRMQKAMREVGLEEPEVEGSGMYTIVFSKRTTPKIGDATPKVEAEIKKVLY